MIIFCLRCHSECQIIRINFLLFTWRVPRVWSLVFQLLFGFSLRRVFRSLYFTLFWSRLHQSLAVDFKLLQVFPNCFVLFKTLKRGLNDRESHFLIVDKVVEKLTAHDILFQIKVFGFFVLTVIA